MRQKSFARLSFFSVRNPLRNTQNVRFMLSTAAVRQLPIAEISTLDSTLFPPGGSSPDWKIPQAQEVVVEYRLRYAVNCCSSLTGAYRICRISRQRPS